MRRTGRAHALLFPLPLQGHINAFAQLSALLIRNNVFVTFLNTQDVQEKLAPKSIPGIRFLSFACNLSPLPNTCGFYESFARNSSPHIQRIISESKHSASAFPPVTALISDGILSFMKKIADDKGIPRVSFRTTSVSSFLPILRVALLLKRGFVPLPEDEVRRREFENKAVDCIPNMRDYLRVKDLPTLVRATNDAAFQLLLEEMPKRIRPRCFCSTPGRISKAALSTTSTWNLQTKSHRSVPVIAEPQSSNPRPLAERQLLPELPRQAENKIRSVRELWKHRGSPGGRSFRIGVGSAGDGTPDFVDQPSGCFHRRIIRSSCGAHLQNKQKILLCSLGSADKGIESSVCGRVFDALRMELCVGEPVRGSADDLLADDCRAAYQLQTRLQRLESGAGLGPARWCKERHSDVTGDETVGRRGGRGFEKECARVARKRSAGCFEWWLFPPEFAEAFADRDGQSRRTVR
eukprot:TRINITY_DN6110_c0_g1_i8.p1 TRINITY_DN6110_c0_g1~~TRINITY_DN6110_c0_g1_i8.p1  ORF type:complete len:465 (+),score=-6.53 TRINITY_DN6110_c0_g1_i8:44-1438(+)